MHRFLEAAGGSPSRALRLYRWNAQVASAYWTPIHFLEIAVRNAMHDALTTATGTHWWFRDSGDSTLGVEWMYDREREAVNTAIRNVTIENPPVTAGKVVAELPFGFWVGLLSGRYHRDEPGAADYHDIVWVEGGVSKRFPGTSRKPLHGRLNVLRRFRNRIAHHEHLLNQDLDEISVDLDSILTSLCPSTAVWVRAMSNVAEARRQRP